MHANEDVKKAVAGLYIILCIQRQKGLTTLSSTKKGGYAYAIFCYLKWPLGFGQLENKGRITTTEDDLPNLPRMEHHLISSQTSFFFHLLFALRIQHIRLKISSIFFFHFSLSLSSWPAQKTVRAWEFI